MKETYWGYWLVILGVFVIGVMLLVNNISTTNTQDYYNIKEVTQASMIDAVDFAYYRLYGNLKISEQKFVENFIRRFTENVNIANTYDIDFYDLYEVPPKVSVKISTGSRAFNIGNTANNAYDVVTTISQILELGAKSNGITTKPKNSYPCVININTELMKYFQGEEVKDRYGSTYYRDTQEHLSHISEAQREKVKEFGDNLSSFKTWFMTEYTIEGQDGHDYFASHGEKDLNSDIKTFVSRGWIWYSQTK